MHWDIKGLIKDVVGTCCNAIAQSAVALWVRLSRIVSAIGLFFITLGAFSAIVCRNIGKILVHAARWLLIGIQMLGRAIQSYVIASGRWLAGTGAFLWPVLKQMFTWQGIVRGSGRAVQVVRAFPRAFVNRAVLFNPPFYMIYTAVSLMVMLAVGSLVYWRYGNVFTRYALAQHQAIDSSLNVAEEDEQLQNLQNRLEARITATEQRLKELEMKTISLEKQTEEKLEDVSQSVDERVEDVEQKTQQAVAVVDQKAKAIDQQVARQQAVFQKSVATVEKHISAVDAKSKKLDSISHEVNKSVAALGKSTKQQIDSLAHKVDEKTGAVERNVQHQVHTLQQKVANDINVVANKQEQHAAKVIARLDAMDVNHKEMATQTKQELAQVHKKLDANHQATQQTLAHLGKSIDEKTTAVAAQAKHDAAKITEQLNEQIVSVHKKIDTTTQQQQKALEQHAQHAAKMADRLDGLDESSNVLAAQTKNDVAQMHKKIEASHQATQGALTKLDTTIAQQNKHIDSLEKDTQQKMKAINQKTAEVESRVGTLERADVQEARRLSVIGHHVQQEVDAQMKKLRNDALENKKKADRKKVLARFLDQLAEEED